MVSILLSYDTYSPQILCQFNIVIVICIFLHHLKNVIFLFKIFGFIDFLKLSRFLWLQSSYYRQLLISLLFTTFFSLYMLSYTVIVGTLIIQALNNSIHFSIFKTLILKGFPTQTSWVFQEIRYRRCYRKTLINQRFINMFIFPL